MSCLIRPLNPWSTFNLNRTGSAAVVVSEVGTQIEYSVFNLSTQVCNRPPGVAADVVIDRLRSEEGDYY